MTAKQQKLLQVTADYVSRFGFQPSYRELQVVLGYRSVNTVAQMILSLRKQGVIWATGPRGFAFDWRQYLSETERHRAKSPD